MTALLSFGTRATENSMKSDIATPKAPKVKREMKLSLIPTNRKEKKETVEETPTATYQSYTVASGDTLEKIIIRFYGKNDVSKIDKIVEANKLSSPNNLSIGQKLVIPMN